MWPRSTRFDQAVRGLVRASYTARVDAYRGGALKYSGIPFVAGSITLDIAAASRRSLSLEVVDPDGILTPRRPTDFLSAYGNELAVWCGFDFHDGAPPELVPMGRFRITRSNPTNAGQISVSALDRSEPVAAAGWETMRAYAAGTANDEAIRDIVGSRLPDLTFDFEGTTATIPLTVYQEGGQPDPWRAASDLALAAGKELYFNPVGALAFRQRPDPDAVVPVWSYAPGPDNIRMGVAADQVIDDVRNVWIVVGEGAGLANAVRGSAEVTDATSPIHPGVIGRRPKFVSTPLARSADSAQRIAEGMRQTASGIAEAVTFAAVPHPAHEPGDVVALVDDVLGLNTTLVLAGWSFDLRFAQPATFTTLGRRFD